MNWRDVSRTELHREIERLRRDIQDFDARAMRQRVAVERERHFSASDPLYQRLTSIREHLRGQLRQVEAELARRNAEQEPTRPSTALRAVLAALRSRAIAEGAR